jgi:hypothetical protein
VPLELVPPPVPPDSALGTDAPLDPASALGAADPVGSTASVGDPGGHSLSPLLPAQAPTSTTDSTAPATRDDRLNRSI